MDYIARSRHCFFTCWILLAVHATVTAQEYTVTSPDGSLSITIGTRERLTYSVSVRGSEIISASPIGLRLVDEVVGETPVVVNSQNRKIDETLTPVVPEKFAAIRNVFSELSLELEGNWGLDVRAFDDGVAYRFRTSRPDEMTVENETFNVTFTDDHEVFFHAEESFLTHSERLYEHLSLSEITGDKMASMPVLVTIEDGPRVAITESDLRDYPGMYLTGAAGTGLRGKFPAFPSKEEQTRDRTVKVVEREDWIARTEGRRSFPWRVFVITGDDAGLVESTMVYRLAPQLRLEDTSWIRPGKVAWDWWNALNLTGVNFPAGVNTATYKHYIDFASENGIEYVILDEGWYELGDLFAINPEVNMEDLLAYAKGKKVGLILWVVWKTLDDQFLPALDRFEEWGVAGIKVDFMQRDDQPMVNYYWKVAEEAAKRQLLVDFHGAYKPSGLRRAYPNVLTREGVLGLEHVKWSKQPTPEHNVTIPFIRMMAGPMDYTPGAMLNAQEKHFHSVFDRPMSMGTRCHQLAMFVVYESPLQMLADSPSNYRRETECLKFLSDVPTVWDETRVLSAKVGDYIAVARRRGDEWWVGAMTDWSPRDLTLDLAFLGPGEHAAEIYKDGVNADRNASDYRRVQKKLQAGERITVHLAPGGGWAARIR